MVFGLNPWQANHGWLLGCHFRSVLLGIRAGGQLHVVGTGFLARGRCVVVPMNFLVDRHQLLTLGEEDVEDDVYTHPVNVPSQVIHFFLVSLGCVLLVQYQFIVFFDLTDLKKISKDRPHASRESTCPGVDDVYAGMTKVMLWLVEVMDTAAPAFVALQIIAIPPGMVKGEVKRS